MQCTKYMLCPNTANSRAWPNVVKPSTAAAAEVFRGRGGILQVSSEQNNCHYRLPEGLWKTLKL